MLKQLKWSAILVSVAYIVGGVLLCMYPELSGNVICYMLGIAAGVFGIINLVTYFVVDVKDSFHRNDFVIGMMSLIAGILIIMRQDLVIEIVPILLGLMIVTSGFMKMQQAVISLRIGYDKWGLYLFLSLISIGLGVYIMFFMTGTQVERILFRWIGGSLIYCGVTDLGLTLFLANKFSKFVSEFENNPVVQAVNGAVVDAEIVTPEPVSEIVHPEPAAPAETTAEPAPAESKPVMEFPEEPAMTEETPAAEPEAAPEETPAEESTDGEEPQL